MLGTSVEIDIDFIKLGIKSRYLIEIDRQSQNFLTNGGYKI
jgi:hypothetical protein